MFDLSFYKGKRVLVTGHTGFKGTWMCQVLLQAGAEVTGFALEAPTEPNLFGLCNLNSKMNSIIGDIRNFEQLKAVFDQFKPEIVFHLAAQPIVRDSYKDPVYTYDVNVMGTVHLMECVRLTDSVLSVVNVTTDKVYLNKEWPWGYRENEELNGYDPYSNSKSCSELVTSSYINSFFKDSKVVISTVRAGNVIGGGDFANDRIIPDCVRSIEKKTNMIVRNPYSTRPYQHVLEPVVVYLLIAEAQYKNRELASCYNVGPDDVDCYSTGDLVTLFCDVWNQQNDNHLEWTNQHDGGPHEANFLKLDCSKLKTTLNWTPKWNVKIAMEKIVEWTKVYLEEGDIEACVNKQIQEFLN